MRKKYFFLQQRDRLRLREEIYETSINPRLCRNVATYLHTNRINICFTIMEVGGEGWDHVKLARPLVIHY